MNNQTLTVWRSFALKVTLIPLLISIVCIPSGLAYVGLASSQAMGTMLTGLMALILAFVLLKFSYLRLIYAVQFLVLFLLCVILHLMLAKLLVPIDIYRAFLSLLSLIIFILGAWAIAELIFNVSGDSLEKALKVILIFLSAIAVLGVAGWMQVRGAFFYSKPVFPFSEPSHLAMTSAPFFIFVCIRSHFLVRFLVFIGGFIVALLLENLTLLVLSALVLFLSSRARYFIIFIIASIPLMQMLDLSYYFGRIDFNDQSQNLSALVYLQGWQLIQESLEKTYFMGLGFQQLGLLGSNVIASRQLELLFGQSMNLMDGGFTLSKLLSEFGVFGGILFFCYLSIAIRAFFLLRRVALENENQHNYLVFSASCIVGYFIEMLMRGAGYFTPTSMLLIASILLWRRHKSQMEVIKPRI